MRNRAANGMETAVDMHAQRLMPNLVACRKHVAIALDPRAVYKHLHCSVLLRCRFEGRSRGDRIANIAGMKTRGIAASDQPACEIPAMLCIPIEDRHPRAQLA